MPGDADFLELLRGVRGGDERAAEELVRRHEPLIRFEVRLRLTDPRVRRLFDSGDVCQSVMASFFVRAASGQFDLYRPEHLIGLLVRMARNKVASLARRQQARPADWRRDDSVNLDTLRGSDGPGREVDGADLLRAVRLGLSEEERSLATLRSEGRAWPEIAETLGGTPEARRKQLARALDRVAGQLGIDEGDHG